MSLPGSLPNPPADDHRRTLKVLSFNVWGLAIIAKKRKERIRAIATYLASSSFDIVCLQELWVYKDYEIVKNEVSQVLPFSRFFHTGALGSGLAIFTRFPFISAQALPYSLSGSPHQAFAGDFFVKKAAGNIVILHPLLGEVEIWNTHMHAAGEHAPDTRQAHRISQSWQLANAIRSGADKGRYVLCMGDFNSQPNSVPVAILRNHGEVEDSYLTVHPYANDASTSTRSAEEAVSTFGMTCDSRLNSWSASKPIPDNVYAHGGKRLDYIFYRQPSIARRRPLIWGYRDDTTAQNGHGDDSWGRDDSNGDSDVHLEEGKALPESVVSAPRLQCFKSEVVLTEIVPGHDFSYSDHFGLSSTFYIQPPKNQSRSSKGPVRKDGIHGTTDGKPIGSNFTPLVPLIQEPEDLNANTTSFAPPPSPPTSPLSPRRSGSSPPLMSTEKSNSIRSALNTLRLYTRISQKTAKNHMRIFLGSVLGLIALTIGSAWQPKSWLQPIFTLLGGFFGVTGATFLYTGFVWGKWELGLLTETTEEMELELRVVEMEERARS